MRRVSSLKTSDESTNSSTRGTSICLKICFDNNKYFWIEKKLKWGWKHYSSTRGTSICLSRKVFKKSETQFIRHCHKMCEFHLQFWKGSNLFVPEVELHYWWYDSLAPNKETLPPIFLYFFSSDLKKHQTGTPSHIPIRVVCMYCIHCVHLMVYNLCDFSQNMAHIFCDQ